MRLAIAVCSAVILGLAASLTPAPSGVGTHVALGLPPCPFLSWTGLPCPTCGLTTAFSLLAHGQILRSLHVQPLGLPLFLLVCVAPWLRPSLRWAQLIMLALLLTWLARLFALDVVPAREVELLQLADQVSTADA